MEKLGLRQKCTLDLLKRVSFFKRTIKQWFYFIGIKYLKTHTLTENQELWLEEFTDYVVDSIEKVKSDEFLEKASLDPIDIPKKS